MKSQISSVAGGFQITVTAKQLDVIMEAIEGMFGYGNRDQRSASHLAREIDAFAQGWTQKHPGDFCAHVLNVAPAYRQMLTAWEASGAKEGIGSNAFADIFELMEAVRSARGEQASEPTLCQEVSHV